MAEGFVNKKGYNDRPYKAGLEGKTINLWAESLADAKQTAVEHFRPKKRQAGLLWVVLADEAVDTASL